MASPSRPTASAAASMGHRRAGAAQVALQVGTGQGPVGVVDEGGGRRHIGIDQGARAVGAHARHGLLAGAHDQVTRQHQVGLAHGDTGIHQLARVGASTTWE